MCGVCEETEDAPSKMNELPNYVRPANPLLEASSYSKLMFSWPFPLLKLGMERPIEDADLAEIPPEEGSAANLSMMEQLWKREVERAERQAKKRQHKNGGGADMPRPSLHRAIFLDFVSSMWIVQILMGLSYAAKLVQALMLGLLLETFESTDLEKKNQGYMWAAILVICGAVILFEHHHVFFITWRKGMQYRISMVAAIYAKALRLKSTAGTDASSSGKIMNIASNDVERFLLASLFVSYLFWAPLLSLAILGLGIKLIGPAFAAGYSLLVLVFVPLQYYLSKRFATLRSKVAIITDERVTLVSQAVAGVRVMKMAGWEDQFEERIAFVRAREIDQIQRANRLKALNEAVFFASNVIVAITIFAVHVALGNVLTPKSVYTAIVLINIVQIEMTKHLSLGVMGVSECSVSISRIQRFFEYPELTTSLADNKKIDSIKIDAHGCVVSAFNVTCYWSGSGKKESIHDTEPIVALKEISLDLKAGELICVIGSVGAGKSALIQMLAGELENSTGSIARSYSSLSYAAQDPWIMDGTIRENIVLGVEFVEEWYLEVVSACGLTIDFQQFRNGDMTIVGDRGVQCSGGQRARIGLARALYRDSDLLLLDDPLSAVDAKVGRLIFYSAIQNLLVKRGKCVVLATHQHQFIHDHKCVLMQNGCISCIGSYNECIIKSDGKLTKSIFSAEDAGDANKGQANAQEHDDIGRNTPSKCSEEDVSMSQADANEHEEVKMQGIVKIKTLLTYCRAMGGVAIAILLIFLFSITQASVLAAIAVQGIWSEKSAEKQMSTGILGLIFGLGVTVVVLSLARAFGCFALLIKASQVLHDNMTKSVLRTTVEFFDTNPLGRVLNRFSADVGSNDDMLPSTIFDFLMCFFICIGALVTTLIILPYTLIAIPPLLWYFLWVRKIYVTTTRELKRLEGLARSPIFAMLGEALGGIATIRANGVLEYFEKKFEISQDAHSRAFFAFISCSRWVGFRMDSIMFLFISTASFLAVLFNTQEWFEIDSAIFGLSLTMLLQLSGLFQWAVRQSAEAVNLMVAVERVSEFGSLPTEAPLLLEGDKAHSNWPNLGSIEVKNLSVRYRPSLPLSLKNISFKIQGGQRVGVVGRTGSGKSTLVQALFRLLEAEDGQIFIDGVDVATLGLHKLRTSMSVIPQFPVLFSGCTVRENLDPFHHYSDDDISNALRDVCMIDVINELSGGPNSIVAEGGSNFSVGQRQLLCLARAILRKNQILILDEATANVDSRTDHLLQEAVTKSFGGATIISVAHRLDTVIDYDKILVLGDGGVLAFGTPHHLATEKKGVFGSMIDDTGKHMAHELRRRASRGSLVNLTDMNSNEVGNDG